ncbi:MAG: DUF2975 domain-containing protein [Eubacterium sp.]|nr:DUF2975 domain-containing protein [Eubacterium sp.]
MKEKKITKRTFLTVAAIWMVAILSFFMAKDFISNLITDKNQYEVRYEVEKTLSETTDNDSKQDIAEVQKLYRLYKNGEYMKDIDINKYSYVDDNGNTDYKYCALIEDTHALISTLLLAAMIVLGVLVARESSDKTPFTVSNVNKIKAISILQLLYAVLPGMVSCLMSFFKFSYYNGDFGIRWFYMLIISFVTALIANVFQYGVRLQEDSDSIA